MSSTTGIPNSYTIPAVSISVNIMDSSTGTGTSNVLVIGSASSNAAYAQQTDLYPVSTLTQLATDFGTDSDIYKDIAAFRAVNSAASVYALNVNVGTTSVTTSNGTITTINTALSTASKSTDMAGANIVASGGTGSGATFNVTSTANEAKTAFTPASVSISAGGSGYSIGDKLTIANVGTITITALDSETSTVNQDNGTALKAALANIGNIPFKLILGSYNDTSSLQAISTFLVSQWQYDKAMYGMYMTLASGTLSQLVKLGPNFNYDKCFVIGAPTSLDPYVTLGASAANIIASNDTNPALPKRGYSLNSGIIPAADRLSASDRDILYTNGFCTITSDTAGNPILERTRISATTDSSGMEINDVTLETPFQTMEMAERYQTGLSNLISTPRILVPNGTYSNPSIYMVTPDMIRARCIAIYLQAINDYICTDMDSFKSNLSVTIDSSVKGRVDILLICTLTSGLNQIAMNLTATK